MEALLIIDLQNDFVAGGALPVPEGEFIVPIVNALQKRFDLVCATQDWHPEGHSSFASSHAGAEQFSVLRLGGIDQVLWPEHCIAGSVGADLLSNLDQGKIEVLFRKGTSPDIDSYSAFFDNGHLKSTGLAGYLKEKGVDHLWVCGLAADFCVYYSILDALAAGFKITVVEDAVKAIDAVRWLKLKNELKAEGVSFV